MAEKKITIFVQARNAMQAGLASAGSALRKFGESAAKVGKQIAKGMAVAGAAIAAFSARAVKAQMGAAVAEAKLAAVLKSTEFAAGKTAAALGTEAKELQKLSGIAATTITQSQALIATFKEIKGDTFTRATKAVADMATIMEEGKASSAGLKAASIQLGKALNDPIAGIGSLSRVGIQFTAEQKDMIKAFAGSGDILQAQNLILAEVESQFGGAAEAAANADFGVSKFGVAIGSANEAIGKAIAANIGLAEKMEASEEAAYGLADAMRVIADDGPVTQGAAAWMIFFENIRYGFVTILDYAGSTFDVIKEALLLVPRLVSFQWKKIGSDVKTGLDIAEMHTREHADRMAEIARKQAEEANKEDKKSEGPKSRLAAMQAISAKQDALLAEAMKKRDAKILADKKKAAAELEKEQKKAVAEGLKLAEEAAAKEKEIAVDKAQAQIDELEKAQSKREEIAGKTVDGILAEQRAQAQAEKDKLKMIKERDRLERGDDPRRGRHLGKQQQARLDALNAILGAQAGVGPGQEMIQHAKDQLAMLNDNGRTLADIKTAIEVNNKQMQELMIRA